MHQPLTTSPTNREVSDTYLNSREKYIISISTVHLVRQSFQKKLYQTVCDTMSRQKINWQGAIICGHVTTHPISEDSHRKMSSTMMDWICMHTATAIQWCIAIRVGLRKRVDVNLRLVERQENGVLVGKFLENEVQEVFNDNRRCFSWLNYC